MCPKFIGNIFVGLGCPNFIQEPMYKSNMAEYPEKHTAWICGLDKYPTMKLMNAYEILTNLFFSNLMFLAYKVVQNIEFLI